MSDFLVEKFKLEKEFLALSKKTEEEIFQFSLEKINMEEEAHVTKIV